MNRSSIDIIKYWGYPVQLLCLFPVYLLKYIFFYTTTDILLSLTKGKILYNRSLVSH